MLAQPPLCLECKNLRAITRQIGGANKCTKYPDRIPEGIFYRHGECSFYDGPDMEGVRPDNLRNR